MRCTHCGLCCEDTEMMLSNADVDQLEQAGYDKSKFARFDRQGFLRLRNRTGCCVFYDTTNRRCRVYRHRPEGCRIYPVIYSEQDGVILDDLCPTKNSVDAPELGRKGKRVVELLQRMKSEAASRCAKLT